ncbi:hypothetical protein CDA63_02650 [Hymenobacter amundsenii]|uniref:Uncharacterized protein n=1 Tax=Hymenobacter amundsenii TaxID=2006685 RepID=A0A246FPL5_9BACT|nr:hypothetical protein [Hymenobacter amundsenii]OWP64678.1 hypothetical protein CDA63_02650 [Hymenobacter amundsenii]
MSISTPAGVSTASLVLWAGLQPGHSCILVYRAPGTSAEFSVRAVVQGLRRRGLVDYVCLAPGCELRLDWLVAVNGQRREN